MTGLVAFILIYHPILGDPQDEYFSLFPNTADLEQIKLLYRLESSLQPIKRCTTQNIEHGLRGLTD